MIDIQSLLELTESEDVEFKAAQGGFPQSFWETYSAMANTDGGTVYLGVVEVEKIPIVEGIKDILKIQKSLWDSANNSQVVSVNILNNKDVSVFNVDGKQILAIHIPRAPREKKPVYTKSNPFTGTYKRNYEGDYRCNESTVKRMIAESQEPARDARFLPHYGLEDLDQESIQVFRQIFTNTQSNHPFLVSDDQEMLRQLGGWRRDRETGEQGLTGAGLLMFGKLPSILEAFSDYKLDYRELPLSSDDQSQQKWLDRIHTDGSWAGNLFMFYRRVYARLTQDLKVPYRITAESQRIDQSPVHEALREALVNTMIHADFSARSAILITKRSSEFCFTNPGNLRLPLELVIAGGHSDCRNPSLQKMFQMIGAAEQAGSGIPKIWGAWKAQHWRLPIIIDSNEPEITRLTLPMISLIPAEVVALLREQFGEKFDHLSEAETMAVITAQIEGRISNQRLRDLVDMHSSDCSTLFKSLVDRGFLEAQPAGRWTTYHIAKPNSGIPEVSFGIPELGLSNGLQLEGEQQVSKAEILSGEDRARLMEITAGIRASKRIPRPEIVRAAIIEVCEGEYRTAKLLEELLGRSADTLRRNYLTAMVTEKILEHRIPTIPNSPDQAYITKKDE